MKLKRKSWLLHNRSAPIQQRTKRAIDVVLHKAKSRSVNHQSMKNLSGCEDYYPSLMIVDFEWWNWFDSRKNNYLAPSVRLIKPSDYILTWSIHISPTSLEIKLKGDLGQKFNGSTDQWGYKSRSIDSSYNKKETSLKQNQKWKSSQPPSTWSPSPLLSAYKKRIMAKRWLI